MKGFYRRGAALAAMDRWEEAMQAFRRALQLEPANADVAARLREAETEAKKRRTGPRTFDQEKDDGNELYKQGKYDDAAAAYSRALALATTSEQKATILSNRAAAYSQQKFYDKVMRDCNEVLEHDPELALPSTLKALIRRGLALEDAERWEEALADMQRVLAKNPTLKQASDAQVRLRRNLDTKKKLRQQEKFHA
jgi:tetratricopeptide (TPR) repeat protein